jgi:hypothetical protein
MDNLNYAIVLGRGVEGCGVTKCAIEFAKSADAFIFASADKQWGRGKSHDYDMVHFYFGSEEQTERYTKYINDNFDVATIFSVPSITHPIECQLNFKKFINNLTIPKILLQYDHKMQSMRRNASFAEICNSVDLLMTHSLENDFARFVTENKVETPIKKMTLGFDFDGHRKKYWKSIEKQQPKTIRWIGRLSGWKNPLLMIDFHNNHLLNDGAITILEGLEASIGYEGVLVRKTANGLEQIPVNNKFRPRSEFNETKEFEHGVERAYSRPYLYPPYNNEECMERMSLSAFGSDLYELPARMYGSNLENCHCEVVASGAVPIFHKHFGENSVHREHHELFTKCPSGTVWLDYSNMDMAAMTIRTLMTDLDTRERWRETAYGFYKSHGDVSIFNEEVKQNSIELLLRRMM